jgi:hypothetical protein
MSTSFTPEQEQYIQNKLQSVKYHSATEVLLTAFQFLDDYDRSDSESMSEIASRIRVSDNDNSLTKLFGCIKTDIHDVADKHDRHLGEAQYQDMYLAE